MPSKHQSVVKVPQYPIIEIQCDGKVHKFIVENQIGTGGFAFVMKGKRIPDGLRVAIKLRKKRMSSSTDSFDNETEALREMQIGHKNWINSMTPEERAKYNGIHDLNRSTSILNMDMTPRYICHGPVTYKNMETSALVTTLARSNPFGYAKGIRAKDPKKWMGILCILAHQLISRFEVCHHAGYVHRDFKPPNMVFGYDDSNRCSIQLIDFGCCTRWRNRDGTHIAENTKPISTGNFWSSPLQRHQGKEYTRKSDMEMVAMIIWLIGTGKPFPWSDAFHKILKAPQSERARLSDKIYVLKLDRRAFCKGLDPVYLEFFEECDKLKFADKPDYDKMRDIWKNAYARAGFNLAKVPKAFFSHTEIAKIEYEYKHKK